MEYSVKNKKKTFKPLILYSSDSTCNTEADTFQNDSQQRLIDEHIVRTRDMLDYNAQMWENEGCIFDSSTASSSRIFSLDESSQQSFLPFHTPKVISNTSNRSSPSFVSPLPNDFRRRNSSTHTLNLETSGISLLEPQTQTTIPLQLHNKEAQVQNHDASSLLSPSSSLPDSRRNSHNFVLNKSEEEDEYFEEEEVQTNTVTFITEPQCHLTYKPQISRKRRRGNLPKQVTEFLRRWLILHKKHPYPTEREKQKLAEETGLMVNQISNWFINARRRILQPLLESEIRQLPKNENTRFSETSRPIGVNVVGGTNNVNNRVNVVSESSNYQPHHHHNYNYNSSSEADSLLLCLPTKDVLINDERATAHEVPPPWVLLPTKLPAMNILEKDLDAFEPGQ